MARLNLVQCDDNAPNRLRGTKSRMVFIRNAEVFILFSFHTYFQVISRAGIVAEMSGDVQDRSWCSPMTQRIEHEVT